MKTMTLKLISILFITFAQLTNCALADGISLTDLKGRTINVTPLSVDDRELRFIRNDGREYTILLDTLSDKSQTTVESWLLNRTKHGSQLELNNKLVVNFSYNKKEQESIFPDEKRTLYQPSVLITNQDLRTSYRGVIGTLIIVGKSLDTPSLSRIINKQIFTINLSRKSQEKWTGDAFQVMSTDAPFGFGIEIDGYILIVQDDQGNIVYEHASKAKWTRPSGKGLSLEKHFNYNEDLSAKVTSIYY